MTAASVLSPITMKQQQHPVSSCPPSSTIRSSNLYSRHSPASCSGSITKYRIMRKLPLMLKTQPLEYPNNSIIVKPRKNAEKLVFVGSNRHSSSLLTTLRHNYASRGLPSSKIPNKRRRDTITTVVEKTGSVHPDNVSLTQAHTKPKSVPQPSSLEKQKKIMKEKKNERTIHEVKQKEINAAEAQVVRVPVKFGILYDSDDESMDVDDRTPSHRIATAFDSCGSIVSNDQRRHIRFDDYASVIEIPHRHSYTEQEREEIWNSLKVIRENAKRNKVEYSWEDWDWENVLEEDEFCFDLDGMKVHPAHACSF